MGKTAGPTVRKRPDYQTEPKHLQELIWQRGFIQPWELLKIAAWKSANGNLAWLSLNTPETIEGITGTVLDFVRDYRDANASALRDNEDGWARFVTATENALGSTSGMRQLHGVRLPMASAVMAILNPLAWPVIDRWSAKTVFAPVPRDLDRFRYYRIYMQRLVEIHDDRDEWRSIHELDQYLYNLARQGEPNPFPTVSPPRA